jgi:hypothetical protein
MTITIITHVLAFLAGGGGVFVYLHKHQTAAIAAASTLATGVADAKAAVDAVKAKV